VLWLSELLARVVWATTDGAARFVGAMLAVGLQLVMLRSVVQWVRLRRKG